MTRRARHTLVLALALAVVASGCEARTFVALFGDSIAAQAAPDLRRRLRPEHRLTLDASERALTVNKLGAVRAVARSANPPDVVVLVLGAGDANAWHGDARMRRSIRNVLDSLRGVPCVRWMSLKVAGVNGFYRGYVARAGAFNRILARQVRDYPNSRVAPYRQWAATHRGSFKPDGLHHTRAGKVRFAAFVERVVENPRCS